MVLERAKNHLQKITLVWLVSSKALTMMFSYDLVIMAMSMLMRMVTLAIWKVAYREKPKPKVNELSKGAMLTASESPIR